jgi:hypothetical protein
MATEFEKLLFKIKLAEQTGKIQEEKNIKDEDTELHKFYDKLYNLIDSTYKSNTLTGSEILNAIQANLSYFIITYRHSKLESIEMAILCAQSIVESVINSKEK